MRCSASLAKPMATRSPSPGRSSAAGTTACTCVPLRSIANRVAGPEIAPRRHGAGQRTRRARPRRRVIASGRRLAQRFSPATAPTNSGGSTFDEPTKSATNARHRPAVDLRGRADLHHPAVVEHRDAVGHRQRLALVVRHEDEGDAERLLQRLELLLHLLAQLQVQRAERLVEQQHLRPVDTIARASATRCRCPPDSCPGRRPP